MVVAGSEFALIVILSKNVMGKNGEQFVARPTFVVVAMSVTDKEKD